MQLSLNQFTCLGWFNSFDPIKQNTEEKKDDEGGPLLNKNRRKRGMTKAGESKMSSTWHRRGKHRRWFPTKPVWGNGKTWSKTFHVLLSIEWNARETSWCQAQSGTWRMDLRLIILPVIYEWSTYLPQRKCLTLTISWTHARLDG